MALVLSVLAGIVPGAPVEAPVVVAQATAPAVMPETTELEKYSRLWHRCRRAAGCKPGRNIRKHGVRFKWVSGERRHWAERQPRARDVSKRIRKLRAKLAVVVALPYPGPNGTRWAIPWYIVNCESGGSWSAYNPSGASGPYQLLGKGAPMPANTPAKRWVHHRIASRLWAGGAGASHWVCA